MREKRERKGKPKIPNPYDHMTETELRGVIIGKLIEDIRPLKTKFRVGWGYDEQNRFWIHLEEKTK